MKVEILFLCVLAAVGLVSVLVASSFSLAGRRFPWLVSFILLVFVFLQGVATVRRKSSQDPRLSRESLREAMRSHGPIVFWSAGGFLLVYFFGFALGTFLLVLGYLVQNREKWLTALAYAAATGLFIYFGFRVALQMQLYPGLIAELFGL